MYSKNYQPSSLQKKWQNAVRYVGCPATGSRQVQVHHIEGASFKIEGVHVGQWLTMAIHWEMHDPNVDHPFHVSKNKKKFYERYGSPYELLVIQREMVLKEYPDADFIIPDEIMELIKKHYQTHEDTTDQWLERLSG